ncbi:MAG: glycosyltransferase [Bacteroidales bacterium]|nr:glycosyltransferase [Bacteroidales bacterium]
MKRVLVISYYWPPAGGSGVQRWVKFSKYLPSLGWQPVVYTPENPEISTIDNTLQEEIPSEVEVIKHPIVEPYGIYRKLMGKKSSTDMKTLTSTPGKPSLGLLIRSNCFIPDPRVWWVRPSVRFLKKYLKEHPVDVIVTTGPPQSMHLIGLKLSKAMGIPWISDFRDPWTKMYWFKNMGLSSWAEKRHFALEQKVLDSSTVVLTVTPSVQRDMMERTKTPVAMITNGYDESDFTQEATPDGMFNIVHTGIFPSDGNPSSLWNALEKLYSEDKLFREKLRIRLVGTTDKGVLDSIERAGLMGNVIDLGYQSHQVAVREQMSASVLILPLRNDPDYKPILPGKVFEYLASRRPIIGFGQEDGAMAQVIASASAGKVFSFDNYDGVEACLREHWQAYKENRQITIEGDIEQYSRRELSKKLVSLLESIIK